MVKVLPNGMLVGRKGDLVYYVRDGKQCVRIYVAPKNPNSVGQQIHRAKMKASGVFISQFKQVIAIGYQKGDSNVTPYNEAVKYHFANAMEDITQPKDEKKVYRVITDKIKLSRGLIQAPEIYSCTRTGQEIELTWNPVLGQVHNHYNDSLALVAYIPGKRVHIEFNTGSRQRGICKVVLPKGYTEPANLWVFYWNSLLSTRPGIERVSDSVWLGEV